MNNRIKISVIVCTYNGSKKIQSCLAALIMQSYSKERYEIIVVDDGSTDNTSKIVRTYPVKIIQNKKNKGLAESRNIGCSYAKGEIILFTDDDCIPDKNWIKSLHSNYKNQKIMGVGGKIIPYKTENVIQVFLREKNPLVVQEINLLQSNSLFYRFILYIKRQLKSKKSYDPKRNVYSVVGANMSFRRSTIENLNYFDPQFNFGGEEEEFCKRFHSVYKESQLIYDPSSIIFHNYEKSARNFLKRYYSYGIGNARIVAKHKDQNPTIYPFPILILFFFFLSVFNIRFMLFVVSLPLILYPYWLIYCLKEKYFLYAFFAYFQVATEVALNIGYIVGWLRFRNKINTI